MKISELQIRNLRAIENAHIRMKDVFTVVGRNNTGKSTVLEALDFFFDPSKRKLSSDWFPNGDIDATIEIRLTFNQLSPWEQERFRPWLNQAQDTLVVAREITFDQGDFNIQPVAYVPVPEEPWLQDDAISGANIQQWWERRDELTVNGVSFSEQLGTSRPNVGQWKKAAQQFREQHAERLNWSLERIENPTGAANILKGTLPEFIIVPAVRDVQEEVKVTRSNPFGRLIHTLLDKITAEVKDEIRAEISRVVEKLNREGGEERLEQLTELEAGLNRLMRELMNCDVELEMKLPTLQEVFGGARIVVDDGVRTSIDTKGHGMQRSMILTILRYYAEIMRAEKEGDQASERSTVIAIEEPELYMHPQAQRSLMRVLRKIGSGVDQVCYSTHSSLFVDIARFDEICIMRQRRDDDKLVCFPTQLSIEMLMEDLKARKNIQAFESGIRALYGHVFDQAVNEGFFGDKVLVVEGPSESYSFPIYARLLGLDLDRENIAIVHGNGKGVMDRLARIFTGLGIPTYLWFDGDKFTDDKETRRKTLELLELMDEGVESIDDLTTRVGPNCAVLEKTLETTMADEIDSYEDLLEKCAKELGPTGKPLKQRYVARRVAALVEAGKAAPEEIVPSTIQQVIKRVRDLEACRSILHPDAEALR